MLFLMMLPLVTFEAQPLRSHAPYFLIEHINFATDGCLLRLLRIVGAYLVQRLLDGEFVYFSHHALPFQKTKTISQNLRKNSTLQSGANLLAAGDRWISSCLVVFSPRNRLGVLSALFAGEHLGPKTSRRNVVKIEEFGRTAVRKPDFIASRLRHNFVPDDARHHSIIVRDPPARVPPGR